MLETKPEPEDDDLSEEDRRTLLAQLSEVYAESQKAYDASIRTLAAAGVGVTASIGAAFRSLAGDGELAIFLFLVSLAVSLASFQSAQFDIRARRTAADLKNWKRVDSNGWTRFTTALNSVAGLALLTGGVLLALYVSSRHGRR